MRPCRLQGTLCAFGRTRVTARCGGSQEDLEMAQSAVVGDGGKLPAGNGKMTARTKEEGGLVR